MIDDKCAITDFYGADAAFVGSIAVDIFECDEVHLFFLEDAIVAHLVARLLLVKLVLEHVDLVVQLLQFEEKGTCVTFIV